MTFTRGLKSQMNSPNSQFDLTMQLIIDKITRPSQLPGLVRPRLLGMLQNSLESCTCTVISGRAGTGKTSLAADFAQSSDRPVAWYKVDAPDGELAVFFDYLAATIRQQRPSFNEEAIRSLAAGAKPGDMTLFSEQFVFELIEDDSNPLLIVIEDLHLVCDTEWLVPFLERFLPLAPREVHILLTSRTLPPAPLWRMRSKQTLNVIDESSLAFTREEAVALFETYGLSRQHAYMAFDRTNGRAAALDKYASMLAKPQLQLINVSTEPGERSHPENESQGQPVPMA
jgi:LuxR family maltose regulon positive regulatory protein